MIWVVDDQEIEIRFSANDEVEVRQWNEQKKIIQVPVNMPKAEAVWTIRTFLQTRIPDTIFLVEERLEVFDRYWPIKPLLKKRVSFITKGAIHCYISGRYISTIRKIKIKEELLEQAVLQQIGQWEEKLNLLIPSVIFRKSKNKPYTVQRVQERICFDKGISNLSLEAIGYCVFKAVASYSAIEEERRRRLIEKHFPTWKTLEKIITYGYKINPL